MKQSVVQGHTYTKPSVRGKTSQCHNVHTSGALRCCVYPATYSTDDDIIVVS